MSEALNYLYYIFDSMLDWLFEDAELFTNVTVGWVIVVIILFSMVIRSILNLPRGFRGGIKLNRHNTDKD